MAMIMNILVPYFSRRTLLDGVWSVPEEGELYECRRYSVRDRATAPAGAVNANAFARGTPEAHDALCVSAYSGTGT
jgi:hypothetical protein